jgi:hypothetical protein
MLEGTDLLSAYQPLNQSFSNSSPYDFATLDDTREEPSPPPRAKPSPSAVPQQQQMPKTQPANDPHVTGIMYDAQAFNKQYEQEQKIMYALNELKKKKEESVTVSQQPSYFDKLFAKKKELARILQFALIIALGLSLHFLIDHYLKNYIAERDLSPERQLFLRLLYPFAVLFILWNLKVFVK